MARTVGGCVELMTALVPGFDVEPLALDEVVVGVAWTEEAEPLVRQRVDEAASLFPRRRTLPFPEASGTAAAFMRDVLDVHRRLFEEHAELYGDNVRTKLERCLAVTDAEAEAAASARRDYRCLAEETFGDVDLLVVPTLMFVPPPADVDDLAWRDRVVRFTYPFNLLGWPALALPTGPAEGGLPSSLQLVGRAGDDARVLAAGLALEAALEGARI
jgi:Asp-tRNA(Asn)/Glu-tRNA(Gln) amidotransferase A subunit family amidase